MKKPWQIWTLFAVSVAIVALAMSWLSHQALHLDRLREVDRKQTELARREAELQERISSALWRMDSFLATFIAKETTRPWFEYQPFYKVTATEQRPSPLLVRPDLVLLHFEIGPDGNITSPQIPTSAQRTMALSCGITSADVQVSKDRSKDVNLICDYDSLLLQCSDTLLPDASNRFASETAFGIDEQGNSRKTNEPIEDWQQLAPEILPPAGETNLTLKMQTLGEKFFEEARAKRQAQDEQQALTNNSMVPSSSQAASQKQMAQQNRNFNRGLEEYSQRAKNVDNVVQEAWISNSSIPAVPPSQGTEVTGDFSISVREGVMQPYWISDQLILARKVKRGAQERVQGVWIDWPQIEELLRAEISTMFPEVRLEPIRNFDQDPIPLGQVMATLPVQMVIDRPQMLRQLDFDKIKPNRSLKRSGIRMSLLIAWGSLAFAAIAGTILLRGVLRLSERRGTFVSAVSHELRTPLTTFRMYAEMMAEKMVPPERQQQYAQTLKVEAERLWHLVENVLQFARLERTNRKARLEEITLEETWQRFIGRLEGRADRASMKLQIEIPAALNTLQLRTDPGTIEQILFNLVDNACKYAKDAEDKRICITGSQDKSVLTLAVRDFGPGVDKKDRRRMFQPFSKSDLDAANTAQGVGLGLALCRRMAKSLGGQLKFSDAQPGAELILELPIRSE